MELKDLNLKLGRATTESSLDPIPRELGRRTLRPGSQPLNGYDLWNAYEVGFLQENGVPAVFHMRAVYPADSPFMIESKSFKLFLNSFNQQSFRDLEAFRSHIGPLLSECVGSAVTLHFYPFDRSPAPTPLPGLSIDNETPSQLSETYAPNLLEAEVSSEPWAWHSHLLRSNCPITNQPDWGSILVYGQGNHRVTAASLLTYLISLRNHQGFHEQCCEMIYRDLGHLLNPDRLTVTCFYTRRGGLDINPHRTTDPASSPHEFAVWRQ